MGIRYHGSLPDSSQVTEVPGSWHRLLHQMGGSWSPSHYHGKEYSEFCLEEHHLQVWDTKNVGLWQRKTIQQQRIQGLLFKARNQEPLLITKEDNFVLYQPIWPVYFVPVRTPVQKRWCFVPILIPAIPDLFQPYRVIYQVSAGN